MSTAEFDFPATHQVATSLLQWSGRVWFTVAAIGQLAFIGFILSFYGSSTLMGDFAAWNEKPLIDGHIEGDHPGNAMFAGHVLLAALMTLAGLFQLTPAIRGRFPGFHRLSGRVFLVTVCILALGGLWLVWIRGTYLSVQAAIAVSLNGILILAFAAMTIRFAMARQIDAHRRWALRLFMVASGVWFLRLGMMAWMILAGGPVGMNRTMSGPADLVITFGCYLIPLAILECYLAAQRSRSRPVVYGALALVAVGTCVTALGVLGAVAFMWAPFM